MQSEFACHISFRGLLFCRNCKVSGKVENNDDNSIDHDGNASDASIGSASSQTRKKRTKTPPESMKDMIARITNFMKVEEYIPLLTLTNGTFFSGALLEQAKRLKQNSAHSLWKLRGLEEELNSSE